VQKKKEVQSLSGKASYRRKEEAETDLRPDEDDDYDDDNAERPLYLHSVASWLQVPGIVSEVFWKTLKRDRRNQHLDAGES
jgi:hypothetical protein